MHCCGPGGRIGLGHGLGEVVAGGALREVNAPGDFGDGGSVGGGLEHLGLAGGQRGVSEDERVGGQRWIDDAQSRMDPTH